MGQWSTLANLPVEAAYNCAAYYDNAIYNFSGISSTDLLTAVYKLDIAANTWSKVADLPTPRLLACVETVGDKIYLIGGYSNGNPFTTEGAVLEFDPATNQITEKTRMSVPVYGAMTVVHDDKIWVLGGGLNSFVTQTDIIQVYDPIADRWWQSPSLLPRSLRASGAVIIRDVVYFIGGYQVANNQGRFFSHFYKGEIDEDQITWTQLLDFPGGSIMRHSMGTDGELLFLTGGYTTISSQTQAMSNLTYAYNPRVDNWRNEVLKPTPVSYASQMLFDGDSKLYVVAGQTSGGPYVSAVEVYDFEAESKPNAVLSSSGATVWVKRMDDYASGFYLRNTGGLPLEWSAEVSPDASSWLTLTSAASGELPQGQQTLFMFRIETASLAEGKYIGTINITTNDVDRPAIQFPIELNVQDIDVDVPMNVLVEQYTGTWCQFCPFGADSLAALVNRFGDRVVRTSWHDNDAMEISSWAAMNTFIGVTAFPTASVNRVWWPGATGLPIGRTDWGTRANFVVNNMRAPISLSIIDKAYDAVTKKLTFKAKVFFHQGMTGDLRLNVVITEDNLNYAQTLYTPTGNVRLDPYYHKAVVRGIYPDVLGHPLSVTNTFATQSETIVEFDIDMPHERDDSTNIALYVHRLNDGEAGQVQQSYSEALLLGITSVSEQAMPTALQLRQNYPNPFNPSTTLSFDLPQRSFIRLVLSDALGRSFGTIADGTYDAGTHTLVFDARELPTGHYFLTLIAGDQVRTRTMTLMK